MFKFAWLKIAELWWRYNRWFGAAGITWFQCTRISTPAALSSFSRQYSNNKWRPMPYDYYRSVESHLELVSDDLTRILPEKLPNFQTLSVIFDSKSSFKRTNHAENIDLCYTSWLIKFGSVEVFFIRRCQVIRDQLYPVAPSAYEFWHHYDVIMTSYNDVKTIYASRDHILVGPLWEGYHESMLRGHLPRVIYHQVYKYTKVIVRQVIRCCRNYLVSVHPNLGAYSHILRIMIIIVDTSFWSIVTSQSFSKVTSP